MSNWVDPPLAPGHFLESYYFFNFLDFISAPPLPFKNFPKIRQNLFIYLYFNISNQIPSQFPDGLSWQVLKASWLKYIIHIKVLKAMPSFRQVEAEMEEWRSVGAESCRKRKY